VIVFKVAGNSTGQRRIGIVDELHHLLHLLPLREAQSDTISRWLDFGLAVGHVELAKIDAFKAHGDRHVTFTADVLAVVDGWIVGVSVLVYCTAITWASISSNRDETESICNVSSNTKKIISGPVIKFIYEKTYATKTIENNGNILTV